MAMFSGGCKAKAARRGLSVVVLAAWAMAAVLASGCGPLVDPGPNPAFIKVSIDAEARPMDTPEMAWLVEEVTWDWNLYLKGDDGKLLKLSPAGDVRTTAMRENPLKMTATFPVPPGKRRYQVQAVAYQYYYIGRWPAPWTLIFFQRDYPRDLKPGETTEVNIRIPKPTQAPPRP